MACSTKTSKAMQDFGTEMYENESGCNCCSSAVVDFVSDQGGCLNTRFFKEVAFTIVHLFTILASYKG